MLRLNRLAFLLLACFFHFSGVAQTTSCSADFNYSVGNNYVVNFFAIDSLGMNNHWLFGDGTPAVISTNGIVSHQFAQPGQYQIKHFIEKQNSTCRDSVVKLITIQLSDQCSAAFGSQKVTGTLSYQFFNNSAAWAGLKKIQWNFGDGNISDSSNPVHTFSKSGIYNVCLHIETNSGCTSEHCEQLQVIDSIATCTIVSQYFYYKDEQNCKEIHFSNNSSPLNNGTHFTWNFGDGTASHDINPVHSYAQAGKYYVCLVAEAGTNCRKEYCDSVLVNCDSLCNITAAYAYSKDSLDCKSIRFINQSISADSNIHFAWNFGDGLTSHDINPVHKYNHTGKYYVCLVAEAGTNCRKEYCDSVLVNCDSLCNITAAYAYSKDSLDCKSIRFINQSISASSNIHFTWNFGDGLTSHDINPVHNYNHTGRYYVCLVSESGSGCRKEHCDSITVNCSTCNIIARFEKRHDPTNWKTIRFNNVSSPVNNVWQTYWSYGDGDSSHDYNTIHNYDKSGTYNVCLKVISLSGCVTNYCDTVNIFKPDSCVNKANFSHDNSSTNLLVNFEALYQNNAARYEWNFGDGMAGIGKNTSHVYTKSGRYNVCLTVKDDQCSVTHCEFVTTGKTANDSGRVMISPNPAVNSVSINVTLRNPGQVSIRILDGNGAVQSVYSKSGFAGSNRFTLPIDKLSHGLYLIEIRTSNAVSFSRFVKG